jgi:hypothetical protein
VIPKYAGLVEVSQTRKLNDLERGELAVCYVSLCPTFGDQGTMLVGAMWIATKPERQARGS